MDTGSGGTWGNAPGFSWTAGYKGYRKGGKVKKTGPAVLHKGEIIIRKGKRNGKKRTSTRSSH